MKVTESAAAMVTKATAITLVAHHRRSALGLLQCPALFDGCKCSDVLLKGRMSSGVRLRRSIALTFLRPDLVAKKRAARLKALVSLEKTYEKFTTNSLQ